MLELTSRVTTSHQNTGKNSMLRYGRKCVVFVYNILNTVLYFTYI